MRRMIDQSLKFTLLTAVAVIFLCATSASVFAQKKGAITEKEVKDYFVYWWTHDCEAGDECTVTFDSAVRLAPAVQHTFQIPNATYLTYPVKVDFTTHKNGGTFHLQHMTRAVYYFYRNSFDEWEMGKEGEEIKQEKDTHQQGGTAKAPSAEKAPATGNRPAKENTAPNTTSEDARKEAAVANGQPKIDTSEMDNYYEVVRYEYPMPPSTEMYLYLKPKVDVSQRPQFYIQFRDKDGMLVGEQNQYGNGIGTTPLYNTSIGETGKAWVYIPSEKEMQKVVSAKIIRIKQ